MLRAFRYTSLSTGQNIVLLFIILYFSILLHCIVQWVLQVTLPSACSFIVLVVTVLHYMFRPMAIFMCVGYFYFIRLKESASMVLWLIFASGHILYSVFLR
jgi:hypothetical protein